MVPRLHGTRTNDCTAHLADCLLDLAENYRWVDVGGQHAVCPDFYCLLYVSRTWPIPNVGALVGFDLAAQALVLHAGAATSWRFTNVVTETVVR